MARARTKTRDAVLVDEIRESPVDRDLARTTRRFLLILLLLVAAILIVPRITGQPASGAVPEAGAAQAE